MIKLFSASVAMALLAATAAPAIAQTTNAAPQQAAPTRTGPDPNEVICEKQEVIGSRLGSKRICHTRAEWADLKLQDRQELEKAQIRRGMKGE